MFWQKLWPKIQVSRKERKFLLCFGGSLAILTVFYCSNQIWSKYQSEVEMVSEMLKGKQNIGSKQLQVPILRKASFPDIAVQQRSMAAAAEQSVKALGLDRLKVKDESIKVQFAGLYISSNNEICNYIMMLIKQELQRAGAREVSIAYPRKTFELGAQSVVDGVSAELDNAVMVMKDTQLENDVAKEGQKLLLLRIREAGVDTIDRSIYSEDFYIRVAFLAALTTFASGWIVYGLTERYWRGPQWRTNFLATAAGLLVGWNLLLCLYLNMRPDRPRYNMISRVNLASFVRLEDGLYEGEGFGKDEVLLGGTGFNSPQVLDSPKVMAPSEGGFYQLIPTPLMLP